MPEPIHRYAELEIGLHGAQAEDSYQVEIRFTDPSSDTEITPARGDASIDLKELLTLESDPDQYGRRLSESLFHDAPLRTLYGKAKTTTEAKTATERGGDLFLRICLRVGTSAPKLHAVRWELLRDPESGERLATSQRMLFSRFMVSHDWRPIKLRPKAQLKALAAVASPADWREKNFAFVDIDGELSRARESLGGEITTGEAGKDTPLTLDRLAAGLRGGVDILYLACHGFLTNSGEANLVLQGGDGNAQYVRAADLASEIRKLTHAPRLVVLASCQSAGTGSAETRENPAAQTALAPLLAEAGVPAVIAMQGKIHMKTVEQFMPVFFTELLKDGQIDRAMAVARGIHQSEGRTAELRDDNWMPALFCRIKSGRLWYVPGFAGGKDEFDQWQSICGYVRSGEVVPIIGPELSEHIVGSSSELALELASRNGYPLAEQERVDLAKVTQFISTKHSISAARQQVRTEFNKRLRDRAAALDGDIPESATSKELVRRIAGVLQDEEEDPCRILAALDAKVFVSASAAPILERFLENAGKRPKPLVSRWRDERQADRKFLGDTGADCPYVYYVYGDIRDENTWVLTEDDFFDYLIQSSLYHELMPPVIGKALTHSSLLFLGFHLNDWRFRILFRMIMAKGGHAQLRNYNHVGVQVNPDEHSLADAEQAKKYLERYFIDAKIDIYWGAADDFLRELNTQLKKTAGDEPVHFAHHGAAEW